MTLCGISFPNPKLLSRSVLDDEDEFFVPFLILVEKVSFLLKRRRPFFSIRRR